MKRVLIPLVVVAALAVVLPAAPQARAIAAQPPQDPVRLEPDRYRVEFENERVRVLRVRQAPHEKGAVHAHPASVVVFLTDVHARFTLPDGSTQEVSAKAGETRWAGPVVHQIENLADAPFEVLHIEIKEDVSSPGAGR
jgi:quercetin dioxygenase-like cupin family protein